MSKKKEKKKRKPKIKKKMHRCCECCEDKSLIIKIYIVIFLSYFVEKVFLNFKRI